MSPGHLLIFGYGYSAAALARRLLPQGWQVSATRRSADRLAELTADGVTAHLFGEGPFQVPLTGVTHVLSTAPPVEDGDPVLLAAAQAIQREASALRWLGYLSTTGVYGDAGGAWVDETSPLEPVHGRGARRVGAEADWKALGERLGRPVTIFRLPGIYGPGRSALDQLRAGTAKRVVKAGQVFSRVHVDDIAGAVETAMLQCTQGTFNTGDDEPAPPADVVTYAAQLLQVEPPPFQSYEAIEAQLSPMAREFYSASRRISNRAMKAELGYRPRHPTYREGLQSIWVLERNCR